MAHRARIIVGDFRSTDIGRVDGKTLFVGNPPYVRHHLIDPEWKSWLKREAGALGIKASALAGLHAYFFLAIARSASPGDYGSLITAAEWLDVNYGQLIKSLFLGCLGGSEVSLIDPEAQPFPGVATTAAITSFEVGTSPPSPRISRIADLKHLNVEHNEEDTVGRARLSAEPRWSHFTRTVPKCPSEYILLGELCAVHRGQVTGANRVWIEGTHSARLPENVLFPAITKARDLFRSEIQLRDGTQLRRVIDLPEDLSGFAEDERRSIDTFLDWARQTGICDGYISRHRKAWWSVGLREPAPILATYMARRPPTFVVNAAGVRHLNIAHGLYPRESMGESDALSLVRFLRSTTSLDGGRVYAGGLTKFEPREMERIPVPSLDLLRDMDL